MLYGKYLIYTQKSVKSLQRYNNLVEIEKI